MPDEAVGCARPTGAVVGSDPAQRRPEELESEVMAMTTVRVGGKAPDFEAPAYSKGTFIRVKLSEYLGRWVLLCFYPGDFTFV